MMVSGCIAKDGLYKSNVSLHGGLWLEDKG